jgi:hypothetical protein
MVSLKFLVNFSRFSRVSLIPPKISVPKVTNHPHPLVRGGGHTRLRQRGWGSPNSDEGTYTVVLCICKYFVGRTMGAKIDPWNGVGTKYGIGQMLIFKAGIDILLGPRDRIDFSQGIDFVESMPGVLKSFIKKFVKDSKWVQENSGPGCMKNYSLMKRCMKNFIRFGLCNNEAYINLDFAVCFTASITHGWHELWPIACMPVCMTHTVHYLNCVACMKI